MQSKHFSSLYPPTTRYHEIEQLLRYVKEGNSSQLIGLPGVGKSNILNLLAYNKTVRIKHLGEQQKTFHFVLTHFSEMKQKSLTEVMKFLFLELIDSLENRAMQQEHNVVQKLFTEHVGFNDALVLFQGLKKATDYLVGEKHYTIVFLLDRFEEYLPSVNSEFFGNLRILRDRAKYKFSVVFSLNRPLEESIDPILLADFYEFVAGHSIYIPFLDEPGFSFRLNYLEQVTGKKLSKNALIAILALTNSHGKLTRLCIEFVLSQENREIHSSILLQQKSIQGALWELWYFLRPEEQKETINAIKTTSPLPRDIFLEYIGLIAKGKIMIPLFEKFLKETVVPSYNANEKIMFHSENNTISKGDVLLSEKLTVSEFRLLRYLLENPNAIIDRETIINAVWQDATSTAGVTEQALDQLIFRLRKKIEDDTNNPRYIQTVKGRGIKFTQ